MQLLFLIYQKIILFYAEIEAVKLNAL